MSELSRIGVAIDTGLLSEFDELIARRGYPSRSEAFRDLIRDALLDETTSAGRQEVVGTITLVYNHHVRMLGERLTSRQHEHHQAVLSTLHVHLDHDNCLEVIVVRGRAADVKRMADGLVSLKGVRHGRLTITAGDPPPADEHDPDQDHDHDHEKESRPRKRRPRGATTLGHGRQRPT